ncbi:MAG TPA: hypothetical protein VN956_08360 [Pyrinomonadaceae bacterium]|nr:hypothetical protein [Pyrinomonadaceae bacterium]
MEEEQKQRLPLDQDPITSELHSETSYLAITSALISNPSVELWKLELGYLTDGHREQQLEIVGDASEYVKSLWDEADDAVLSEAMFRQALESFIRAWNPSASEDPDRLDIILSLVLAFRPDSGFSQIADHLTNSNWFDKEYIPPISQQRPIDLHLKALKTLQRYFKTAPVGLNAGYRLYLQILKSQLEYPRFKGYVLARLIDLEETPADALQVLDYIAGSPEGLKEIIPIVLKGHLSDDASRAMSELYTRCHSAGTTQFFELVLEQNGCRIVKQGRQVIISGLRKHIELPKSVITRKGIEIQLNLELEELEDLAIEALDPLSSIQEDWLENPESCERKLSEIIQQHLIQLIQNSEPEEPPGWQQLTEQLRNHNIQIRVDREKGDQGVTAFLPNSKARIQLELPAEALEMLTNAYISVEVRVSELKEKVAFA